MEPKRKVGRPLLGATDPNAIGIKIVSLESLGISDSPTIIANTMYEAGKSIKIGQAVIKEFENHKQGNDVRTRLYDIIIEAQRQAEFAITTRDNCTKVILYKKAMLD